MAKNEEPLGHTLGVEMAVDGVVQSLSAAFESELCALTKAIEKVAEIPEDRRTPLHLVSWSKLAAATTVFDIDLAAPRLSISDALVGEHSEEPHGWLAQLLLLRKRLALQDFLVDHDDGREHAGRLRIEVPGRGPLPLVSYLSEMYDLTEELLETMEHDIADAKNGKLYIAAIDEVRAPRRARNRRSVVVDLRGREPEIDPGSARENVAAKGSACLATGIGMPRFWQPRPRRKLNSTGKAAVTPLEQIVVNAVTLHELQRGWRICR